MALKLIQRDGFWHAHGTVAGRRIRKSLGTTDKGLAEQIRAKLEADLHKEATFGPEAVVTFETAVNSYLDNGGEARFLKPLLLHFRGRRIGSIKPGDIKDAARKLYPGRAPATWNRQAIRPMSAVINHAHDRGWCPPIRVKAFPEAAAVRKAVDRTWINAFADTATARGNVYLAELARFMFETGTRIGEAVLIEPRDLDLENARIISRSETTKNGEPRIIHLTKRTVAVLRNLPPRKGRVFGYQKRWSVYGSWKRTCEAAGIDYVPPHQDGRHSFATALDQAQFTASEIAEAGGWKSTALVQKTYIHRRDAGSRVAAHFDSRAVKSKLARTP